jgi:hypothetical protein
MKKILKYKSLFFTTMMAIFFAVPVSAEKESNRLSSFPESKFVDRFSSGSLREDSGDGDGDTNTSGIDLGDTPEAKDALGPIGDAIGWVAALVLVYGIYVFNKKRKHA